MTDLFLTILNMSVASSYVAIVVILARLLLRRAPKIILYLLWLPVLFRLLIPASFTSVFSFFQVIKFGESTGMEFVPMNIELQKNPTVHLGVDGVNRFIQSSLPAPSPFASVNPMQIIVWLGSTIWVTVAVILFLYSVISYLKVLKRMETATLVKDNVYETDGIETPFVCGFLKPKIIVPTSIREHELDYIVLHEQTHIKRGDYLIKPLAYLMLILHWFNPLMWLCYILMSKDMEMSCDENVIRKMGDEIKGNYSTSLLHLSTNGTRLPKGGPLAFGESHIGARIKHILVYRQPSSWKLGCYLVVVLLLVVGCVANPKDIQPSPQGTMESLYSGYHLDGLMKNKTRYIGGASKVGGLIGSLPLPTGLEWNGMELQTTTEPYGLTMNYVTKDSFKGEFDEKVYLYNSIMLLCLIDNAGWITYSIDDGEIHRLTVTREQANEFVGKDVRSYSTNQEGVRSLIDFFK